MVKNGDALRSLEIAVLRQEKSNLSNNMRIVEAMYKEAVLLGAFPLKDRLSGLEVDIRIARAVNSVSKTP